MLRYRIQIDRDARLIGQRICRYVLTPRLRQVGQNQFPHDAIRALAPRPQKRGLEDVTPLVGVHRSAPRAHRTWSRSQRPTISSCDIAHCVPFQQNQPCGSCYHQID